jgi:hypothetical protein
VWAGGVGGEWGRGHKAEYNKNNSQIRLLITKIMFLYLNEFYVNKTLSLQEKTYNLFAGLLSKT